MFLSFSPPPSSCTLSPSQPFLPRVDIALRWVNFPFTVDTVFPIENLPNSEDIPEYKLKEIQPGAPGSFLHLEGGGLVDTMRFY